MNVGGGFESCPVRTIQRGLHAGLFMSRSAGRLRVSASSVPETAQLNLFSLHGVAYPSVRLIRGRAVQLSFRDCLVAVRSVRAHEAAIAVRPPGTRLSSTRR